MKLHTQKKWIALLLLVSCIAGAWLLFITPVDGQKPLKSASQADSLLKLTLSDFNVPEQQRSSFDTQMDSNLTRRTYTVSVPPSFSKTQFHAVLQRRLNPYQITLPARVVFPERDMHIHLNFKNTIFRTIKLVTDEDLQLQRSLASMIIAFTGRPPSYLLDTLVSFGEPISITIVQEPPLTKPNWWDEVKKRYPKMYIWPKTSTGENILADNNQSISVIKPLEDVMPDATLLSFHENRDQLATARRQTSFSFVPVQNAILFNNEMNESEFNQTFRMFVQQAREGKKPIAIIMGTEQTLKWARSELNTFKKGGLFLTPPTNINF